MTAPAPTPQAGDRRNSIGFLRLLLAALVVYVHCFRLGGFEGEFLWTWTQGTVSSGTLAVQCFFVLSGALVATSWLRSGSALRYLWHRALRLLPAFWVCLIVTAFVLTPLLFFTTPEPRTPFFSLDPSAWGYVWHNLLRPRSQIAIDIYPNGGPWAGDWNGSLWTLFYEGACYLMVAGLGLCGLLGRFRAVGATVLIGLIGLYSVWACTQFTHGAIVFPTALLRLLDTPGKQITIFFFAGTLWAVFPEVGRRLLGIRWAGLVFCVVTVAVARLGVSAPLLPWLLPPVLFWLAAVLPLQNFERWIGGDYSYGLYIYGYPLQQVLAHFHVHEAGFYPYLAASLVVTLLFGVASWHLVEKRALALKHLVGAAPVRPSTALPA